MVENFEDLMNVRGIGGENIAVVTGHESVFEDNQECQKIITESKIP